MDPLRVLEEVLDACRSLAGLPYDDEPVDQLQHALQAAALARAAGCEPDVVVAALLHDIARAPAVAGLRFDGPHEHHGAVAERWLTPRVGARIAALAESHVDAKRYLVATEPEYAALLSPVSVQTLRGQGGPMADVELDEFRSRPDWGLALTLRRFDDAAKVPGAAVPPLESYAELLAAAVAQSR
jgi:predicted HD phosphohydrolase